MIITLSVDDELEKRFRNAARSRFGEGKGVLKKAYQEALDAWLNESNQEEIAKRQHEWAKKKWGTGGRLYKTREELYD